jgi:hypothetical protein
MALTRLGLNQSVNLASNVTGTLPAANGGSGRTVVTGNVLQVVSATKTDTQVTSTATFVDVSGLSLSITPSSASNKIFLVVNINIDGLERYMGVKFVRDSTDIGIGDADGSRTRLTVSSMRNQSPTGDNYIMHNSSASFLDTPNTTSATTYKIQAGLHYGSAQNLYINRPYTDDDATYITRGISTLTAYEIAG